MLDTIPEPQDFRIWSRYRVGPGHRVLANRLLLGQMLGTDVRLRPLPFQSPYLRLPQIKETAKLAQPHQVVSSLTLPRSC